MNPLQPKVLVVFWVDSDGFKHTEVVYSESAAKQRVGELLYRYKVAGWSELDPFSA